MKRAFSLFELLIVVAVVAILTALLLPLLTHHHPGAPRSSCQSNLKQIGLAVSQYSQDYNALLPMTQNGAGGWADAIQPYCKSWQLFQCPSVPGKTTPSSDYFFNARLARGFVPRIKTPSKTILLGEGEDDAPTSVNLRQLPPRWFLDQTTPAWRHVWGNYLFVDGHVKSFKPNAISNASPAQSRATFAVR